MKINEADTLSLSIDAPISRNTPTNEQTFSIVVIALGVKGLNIHTSYHAIGVRSVEITQGVVECPCLVLDCRRDAESHIGCRSRGAYRNSVGKGGLATVLHLPSFNGVSHRLKSVK